MNPPLTSVVFIHRGRNRKSIILGQSVSQMDYHFDYRGKHWSLLLLKALISATEIPRADLYLVEGLLCFWVAYFLKKRYPRAHIIVMVTEPGFYLDPKKRLIKRLVFRLRMLLYKKIHGFIAISQLVKDNIQKYTAVPVEVAYHFIDRMDHFLNCVPQSNRVDILFVCERPEETGHVKGLDRVLSIFAAVSQKHPTCTLWITGLGTDLLSYPNSRIQTVGRKALESLIPMCRIVLAPSRYDAFNLAVAEGVVAGLIPVISDSVGAKEFIEDLCPQWVIRGEAISDFVTQIISILESPLDAYNAVQSQLRDRFCTLTEERCLDDFRKAWKSLVG